MNNESFKLNILGTDVYEGDIIRVELTGRLESGEYFGRVCKTIWFDKLFKRDFTLEIIKGTMSTGVKIKNVAEIEVLKHANNS